MAKTGFIVVAYRSNEQLYYYTGRAGELFVSKNPAEAYVYSNSIEANIRAGILGRGSPMHGFKFYIEDLANPYPQSFRSHKLACVPSGVGGVLPVVILKEGELTEVVCVHPHFNPGGRMTVKATELQPFTYHFGEQIRERVIRATQKAA